ncbi:hypothetical protein Btru_045198 [Bulinus truncatus]|nr:hypothetical protein Btru_045198 [Bulinus truncatus]
MVDCMNSSKRIMAVISSRFAQSQWCNFELMLCQSHIISHDLPNVLVIQMDKIEKRHMDSSMIALYHYTSFLEIPDPDNYTRNDDLVRDVDEFWKRLHRSLQNLMPKKENNVRQLGTQTSFSGRALPATPHSPNRRPLLRQMSEQPPGENHARGSRPLRRLKSEMHTPLVESDEQSEETSVMHP